MSSGEFDTAFEENPIDAKLEEDMANATSTNLILRAYDNGAKLWESLIDTAYGEAQSALTGDALTTLETEQQEWENGLDGAVQAIRDENSEDSIASAKAVMEYYRDRAKVLCQAVYEATGQLPQFPSTTGEAVG